MNMYREIFIDGCNETKDNICQIIFEGENTEIGRQITIERIKEYIGYNRWLKSAGDY